MRKFVVGALAVVNAVGDVFTLEGDPLTGGPLVPAGSPVPPPYLLSGSLPVTVSHFHAAMPPSMS